MEVKALLVNAENSLTLDHLLRYGDRLASASDLARLISRYHFNSDFATMIATRTALYAYRRGDTKLLLVAPYDAKLANDSRLAKLGPGALRSEYPALAGCEELDYTVLRNRWINLGMFGCMNGHIPRPHNSSESDCWDFRGIDAVGDPLLAAIFGDQFETLFLFMHEKNYQYANNSTYYFKIFNVDQHLNTDPDSVQVTRLLVGGSGTIAIAGCCQDAAYPQLIISEGFDLNNLGVIVAKARFWCDVYMHDYIGRNWRNLLVDDPIKPPDLTGRGRLIRCGAKYFAANSKSFDYYSVKKLRLVERRSIATLTDHEIDTFKGAQKFIDEAIEGWPEGANAVRIMRQQGDNVDLSFYNAVVDWNKRLIRKNEYLRSREALEACATIL